jgi:hypothetical protein
MAQVSKEKPSTAMFPPSWKSNIENEGRFDFGKVILKRPNVISISMPFKVQVTGY